MPVAWSAAAPLTPGFGALQLVAGSRAARDRNLVAVIPDPQPFPASRLECGGPGAACRPRDLHIVMVGPVDLANGATGGSRV